MITFFRVVSHNSPVAQQRLLTNLKLLNDLSTLFTIADVIQLKSSYTACLQFNKHKIKSSNPVNYLNADKTVMCIHRMNKYVCTISL